MDQSHDVHLNDGLLHHRQLLRYLIMLLSDGFVATLALPALQRQLLIRPLHGLILPEELIALSAGDIHEIGQFVVLHLEGKLEVLLNKRLLFALDALIREK